VTLRAFTVGFLLTTLSSSAASAFVCTRTDNTGPSIAWQERLIPLTLGVKDGVEVPFADLQQATLHAATAWTDASCSDFTITIQGSSSDLRTGFDWRSGAGSAENVNLVVFRDDDNKDADPVDAWLHDNGAIAITTMTYSRYTGRILDADIELNDAGFSFTNCDAGEPGCLVANDLKNTMTHEMGHLVGLDHPPSTTPGAQLATMYGRAPQGETLKRDLAQDDIDGICYLYPTSAEAQECYGVTTAGDPGLVVEQSCAQASGLSWAGLWAFLLLRRRRRR